MERLTKPYLVLVNGVLFDRKVNRLAALKVIEALRIKGVNAVIAYKLGGN